MLPRQRLTHLNCIPKRSVISPAVENETITVPAGSDRHGMERLCIENRSARWWKSGSCQLDELQRQIPSKDLVGHRDKTTRTRQVLQPRIKPRHTGFVWPEEKCRRLCLVAPKVFYSISVTDGVLGPCRCRLWLVLFGDTWLIAQTLLEES